MSEVEEPSAKVSKLEVSTKDQDEELDEGQEEWLSEGILTDEDYNTNVDVDTNESNINFSQDHTMTSMDTTNQETENIEQTLDNFENSNVTDLPGDLSTFLIRKTDGRILATNDDKQESELDDSVRQSEDDGHDTDELLRMLGDDNLNSKKGDKSEAKNQVESSDDDDEYIFEGAKISRLKVARNAIMKKFPSRAVPEESDRDSDMSSDERLTVKKMFGVTKRVNMASKSTAKSSVNAFKNSRKNKTHNSATKTVATPPPKVVKKVPEIIDEEEYLDEEQFDLDEDPFSQGLESDEGKQRIMRPEQMDEEVPTDGESHSDDESLYDELPSSDSEDQTEWFTLDLRAERAGEYLPLLGASARRLLAAERTRVAARLTALKQSSAALSESSAGQAAALRRAALQLQELDAALKA